MAKRFKQTHEWLSVNRDVHPPNQLSGIDLMHEIECVVARMSDSGIHDICWMLDGGQYNKAFARIANAMRRMSDEAKRPVSP